MPLAVDVTHGLSGGGGLSGTLTIAALVVSAMCSGLFSAWLTERRAKRLEPSQAKDIDARAAKTAVETVEQALKIARKQIAALESDVSDLSERVGDLRTRLATAAQGRDRINKALTLALVERAKLQQQITDIRSQLALAGIRPVQLLPVDAILMVRMDDGIIEYATDGVYDLLGYSPEELVGKELEVIVPNRLRAQHRNERTGFIGEHRAREMGEAEGLDIRALTADGEEMRVLVSLHPTGDGRVLALVKRRERAGEQPLGD